MKLQKGRRAGRGGTPRSSTTSPSGTGESGENSAEEGEYVPNSGKSGVYIPPSRLSGRIPRENI